MGIFQVITQVIHKSYSKFKNSNQSTQWLIHWNTKKPKTNHMTFLKISPKPYRKYLLNYARSWLVWHIFLRNVISRRFFLLWRWKWHFCHFRRFFLFWSGNALSNIVSNIRKASSACFPNCPFISSPYWTLSAFFKSEVNDFFAWPLWYSPIHSAQTDLSQGMQWYPSFFLCPEHAQSKMSSLVRLFDVRGTTTWPRVSFFLSWSFLHVS